MKFDVRKSSDSNYKSELEFSTLEELLAFVNITECERVIISKFGNGYILEDYDDWRE